jgi:hypothetical protein
LASLEWLESLEVLFYFSSGVSTEKTVISAARLPMMTNLWNRMMRLISALKVANYFRISARNSVV